MVGFAVISRRTNRRWTRVRDGSSNAESAVNPAVGRRPEEFWYHPNTTSSPQVLMDAAGRKQAVRDCLSEYPRPGDPFDADQHVD
jgi:hypothetical protein